VQLERLILRAAPIFNAPVAALARSPRWSRLVGGNFAIVTYTGRRSGRRISLPVGYRRRGEEIVIGVAMPDAKTWWRNFLGDGDSATVTLNGREHPGHAVASRDKNGAVTVRVQLTP
jgi:hypothetical protein